MSSALEAAGYSIFRHQAEQKCSASHFFETTEGREANITYFMFDDGRTDEIFFGLRPSAIFDPSTLVSQVVSASVDGLVVLEGRVGLDMTGAFVLPIHNDKAAKSFLASLGSGRELRIELSEAGQHFVLNLDDLNTARAALAKCVEAKNADS